MFRPLPILLVALLSSCTGEEPALKSEVAGPPALSAKAHLKELSGDVKIKRAAGDDWVSAAEAMELVENDKVRTVKGASAVVQFINGSSVTLGEEALIAIAETRTRPGANRADLTVLQGHVDAELGDPAKQSLSVMTPAATVRAGREIVFQ